MGLVLEIKKSDIVHVQTPGGECVSFRIAEKNSTAKVALNFLNDKEFKVVREKVSVSNDKFVCCDHCGEVVTGWPRSEYPDWIFFCSETCRREWKEEREDKNGNTRKS